MASRIKGITIQIGADVTPLDKALKGVNDTLRKTQSNLRDVNKLLKLNPGNVTLLKQKQEELNRAISAAKEKIKTEKQALKELKKADQTPEVIEQQKRLERQIIADEQELKRLQKEMRSFGSVAKQVMVNAGEKIAEVGKKITEVGDKMASAGREMTTKVTVPIVAGFGAAVKATADFDAKMSKVKALIGTIDTKGMDALVKAADEMGVAYTDNASDADKALEILRNKARQVASQTQYDANEVAEAYSYMALAGWEASDMIAGISGVMDLAAASGEDLANVSDIVTDGLTAFGLTADDTSRFVDVLAQTMSKSNTTVGQMGEAFKYVAPVAGSLGYSVEDVSLALGLMANSGIKASTAGTTLRNILTNMAKPTDEMQSAMDRLGIELEDGEGNLLSFGEIIDNMREGFGNLKMPLDQFEQSVAALDAELESGTVTEEEYEKKMAELVESAYGAEGAMKAQTAAMLAGKRGMSGLLAIVNASDEDYSSLKENIEGATGAAEQMRETMMDNLAGALKVLRSNLMEVGIQLADIMMPTIQKVVEKVQQFVNWLKQLNPATQETIIKVAMIAAAIGPVLLIMGTLVSIIGKVVTGIGMLVKVIGFVASPVGLIVVAIAALVAGFIYLWNTSEKFRNFWINLWNGIKEAVGKAVEWVKNAITTLQDVWGAIVDAVTTAWDTIKNAVQVAIMFLAALFDAAKQIFLLPWTFIWENFGSVITEKWEKIKHVVQVAITFVKIIIEKVFNAISAFVTNVMSKIWQGISNRLAAIRTVFTNVFNGIKTFVSNVFNAYKTVITTALNAVKTTVGNILDKVKGVFTDKFNGIKKFVQGIVDFLKGIFKFEWKLPHIKLPHFRIDGEFSLSPPKVPSLKIDWYKKAYGKAVAFDSPTVLSTDSGLKGFGDGSGAEIVIGQDLLMNSIRQAAGMDAMGARLDTMTALLAEYLPELADMDIYLDNNALVGKMAPAMNRQLGMAYR